MASTYQCPYCKVVSDANGNIIATINTTTEDIYKEEEEHCHKYKRNGCTCVEKKVPWRIANPQKSTSYQSPSSGYHTVKCDSYNNNSYGEDWCTEGFDCKYGIKRRKVKTGQRDVVNEIHVFACPICQRRTQLF